MASTSILVVGTDIPFGYIMFPKFSQFHENQYWVVKISLFLFMGWKSLQSSIQNNYWNLH